MALPNRFPRFQGPRPVDMTGPYRGVNSIPQHVSGFREGFNKTPKNVLESLFNLPDRPSHQDVQGLLQSRNQQADAGHASAVSAANDALKLWGVAAPMIGQYESGAQAGQAAQRQPYPSVPRPVQRQQVQAQPQATPVPIQQASPQRSNPPGTHYGDWMLRQRQMAAGGASPQQPVPAAAAPSTQPPMLQRQVAPQGYQGPSAPRSMPVGAVAQMLQAGVDPVWRPNPAVDMATERLAEFALNRVPQPLPSNQRYPLPMQMPDGGANALADAINTGSPVPMPSKADPAVWGPGGRQYPAVTPASQGGGQQPLSVAPRYGQSAQQAAMSLQNARQQARDFTSRGVDRIFATNGSPVTQFAGGARAMDYGSGSRLIQLADGRVVLTGNRATNGYESALTPASTTATASAAQSPSPSPSQPQQFQSGVTAAALMGGAMPRDVPLSSPVAAPAPAQQAPFPTINLRGRVGSPSLGMVPQGQASAIQNAAANSSAEKNKQRYADVADQRAEARDRRIVTNAMRFGVRNPLAIETAQRMGIRLPGMPRMSGDAAAAPSSQPTTQQVVAGLVSADADPSYGFVQQGFKPSAAQGSEWSNFLQNPALTSVNPQNIRAMQGHIKAAISAPNFKASDQDRAMIAAFLSGGPQATQALSQKWKADRQKQASQNRDRVDAFQSGRFGP